MKNQSSNTIVTIGDVNYLWGIFLLIASARKSGMTEPFIVGTKDFDDRAKSILTQCGGVTIVPLDGVRRSLACSKSYVMLGADTEYVTWADSDAFFSGNVSELLPPASPEEIHFRLRSPAEMPAAFRGHVLGAGDTLIPADILAVWKRDVAEVAGSAAEAARYATTGSSCFCALSLRRHRKFLEIWDALQKKVLPERNVGVVDTSLRYYHQLDESTLNACLNFVPDAPRVQETFRLNKDRERLFVHFIARPKPWVGWTKRAFRHFDRYVGVAAWAAEQGYELPGPLPACLKAENKALMKALIPWMTLKPKLAKLFRR
jgi:hypothetical protein